MIFIIVCLVAYVLIVSACFVVVRKFKKKFLQLQADYNESLSLLEALTSADKNSSDSASGEESAKDKEVENE